MFDWGLTKSKTSDKIINEQTLLPILKTLTEQYRCMALSHTKCISHQKDEEMFIHSTNED